MDNKTKPTVGPEAGLDQKVEHTILLVGFT